MIDATDKKNSLTNSLLPLHILLADDDIDDRYFFEKVVKSLSYSLTFSTVIDGEELLFYLHANENHLPDVLFLDLNMPKKNGSECLVEIKQHPKLKDLPVIIYSTSVRNEMADLLYSNGAHYYIRKTDVPDLQKMLTHIISLFSEDKFTRPTRENFILSLA